MQSDLSYYSQPVVMTSPGKYAYLFNDLPMDIVKLVKIVQGMTIHVFWVERYGIALPPERKEEVQLRILERRLARTVELYPCPLTEVRPLDKKLVGNCRDHTLLLIAMLRHLGIPARARCGFAAYFMPDHFEDHWVAEYWNATENRWVLVDAQLDQVHRDTLKFAFDPLDVPRDQFLVGGAAWQMCRNGKADPDKFGIFDMKGLGFIRGNLVRDTAALNKVELLPWDCWGIIEKDDLNDPDDLSMLDQLAELTAGDVPDYKAVWSLYQSDPRLQVSSPIHSYVNGIRTMIDLEGV